MHKASDLAARVPLKLEFLRFTAVLANAPEHVPTFGLEKQDIAGWLCGRSRLRDPLRSQGLAFFPSSVVCRTRRHPATPAPRFWEPFVSSIDPLPPGTIPRWLEGTHRLAVHNHKDR